MNHKFQQPADLQALAACLGEKDENTWLLAGGTDLAIQFNEKKCFDYHLIDLTGLRELQGVEEKEDTLIIGAGTTMTELHENTSVQKFFPALAQAAYAMGSTQIRNRATLGGNVANASQSADALPVLFAHEADCELLNSKNEIRRIPVMETVTGLGKNTLASDECILRFILKKTTGISGFAKTGARKTVAISKLNCCILVWTDNNRTIEDIRIFLGAVGPKPLRAEQIEQAMKHTRLIGMLPESLRETIRLQIDQLIPTRASRPYKREVAAGVVEDTVKQIVGVTIL